MRQLPKEAIWVLQLLFIEWHVLMDSKALGGSAAAMESAKPGDWLGDDEITVMLRRPTSHPRPLRSSDPEAAVRAVLRALHRVCQGEQLVLQKCSPYA